MLRLTLISLLLLSMCACSGSDDAQPSGEGGSDAATPSSPSASDETDARADQQAQSGSEETPPPQVSTTAKLSLSTVREQLGLPAESELIKLPADGGQEFNRLVFSSSPYLLQHAKNPIDWHAWTPAAFELARESGRPVFISVGYSSCHWCHVMEKESFVDPVIAAYLNEHFICIKVDREERPDIDDQLQAVINGLDGGGGWPASVVTTAQGRAVKAGTYLPPKRTARNVAFSEWLEQALEEHERFVGTEHRRKHHELGALPNQTGNDGTLPDLAKLSATALNSLVHYEDTTYGGFGERDGTRFPRGHVLSFLFDHARRYPKSDARVLATSALDAMLSRGIYDHLAGGFHRYTLDRQWLQPHFEKMLYDQASMSIALADAYELTGNDRYAQALRETLDFVLRDLALSGGGFASAMNATIDRSVAEIFTWTRSEVIDVLGEEQGTVFCQACGVTEAGTFIDEVTGELTGRSVLWQAEALSALAQTHEASESALRKQLAASRAKLAQARSQREGLLVDSKLLVDLNGMFLQALARAGEVLQDKRYTQHATALANTLLSATNKRGELLHNPRARNPLPAMLPDYASLARGLFALHQNTQDPQVLTRAIDITQQMIERFGDLERGGFWMRSLEEDQESIIANYMPHFDLAYPSGTGLAMQCLVLACEQEKDAELEHFTEKCIAALAAAMRGYESEHAASLSAFLRFER